MTAIKRGRQNPLTLQKIASYGHQILTVNDIANAAKTPSIHSHIPHQAMEYLYMDWGFPLLDMCTLGTSLWRGTCVD